MNACMNAWPWCCSQAVETDIEAAEAAHKGEEVHADGTDEEPESAKDTREEAEAAAQEARPATQP